MRTSVLMFMLIVHRVLPAAAFVVVLDVGIILLGGVRETVDFTSSISTGRYRFN